MLKYHRTDYQYIKLDVSQNHTKNNCYRKIFTTLAKSQPSETLNKKSA